MAKKQKSSFRSNVINIRLNAKFFYEKAVQSLDRHHYDKALKYFRKVVEYESDNPVNYCNLAGILSEMGQFEESNKVLKYIVEKIDPSMTECYFYMANNYANMENYEEAERQLVKYLEKDPRGYYLEECEEMMEFLSQELERPIRIRNIKSRENFFIHDKARLLLEEGKFAEAAFVLEGLLKKYPDFTAARNNLALAYHYMGKRDKARQCLEPVLNAEPGNIHALCNLALFSYQEQNDTEWKPLLEMLRKIEPLYPEHVFKLAITLGVLGEHDTAYRHFVRLIQMMGTAPDPALYHYAAAAAYNTGKTEEAIQWWKKVQNADPHSPVADFYLKEISRFHAAEKCGDKERLPEVHYYYHLPFASPFHPMVRNQSGCSVEDCRKDPWFSLSLRWAMEHGDGGLKLQAVQVLFILGDGTSEPYLEKLASNPKENAFLREIAAFALYRLQKRKTSGAQKKTVRTRNKEEDGAFQREDVPEMVLRYARKPYGLLQQYDLYIIWNEFVRQYRPGGPRMVKPEAWAAALEYLLDRLYRFSANYREIAERYGVSPTTVIRNVKRIAQTFNFTFQSPRGHRHFNPFRGGREDV